MGGGASTLIFSYIGRLGLLFFFFVFVFVVFFFFLGGGGVKILYFNNFGGFQKNILWIFLWFISTLDCIKSS